MRCALCTYALHDYALRWNVMHGSPGFFAFLLSLAATAAVVVAAVASAAAAAAEHHDEEQEHDIAVASAEHIVASFPLAYTDIIC